METIFVKDCFVVRRYVIRIFDTISNWSFSLFFTFYSLSCPSKDDDMLRNYRRIAVTQMKMWFIATKGVLYTSDKIVSKLNIRISMTTDLYFAKRGTFPRSYACFLTSIVTVERYFANKSYRIIRFVGSMTDRVSKLSESLTKKRGSIRRTRTSCVLTFLQRTSEIILVTFPSLSSVPLAWKHDYHGRSPCAELQSSFNVKHRLLWRKTCEPDECTKRGTGSGTATGY